MPRIVFIAAIASLLLAGSMLSCDVTIRNERQGRPNIMLIFVDDLGYNDVSYNGATDIKTPNIDRIAEEGVVFSNGYVAHPFCGPSRAGLMTGRYPARFGMDENLAYAPSDPDHGLPVDEKTVATYLNDAGYRTGLVGKWQLGAAPPFHPINRGFDYFYGFLAGGHDYFKIDTTTGINGVVDPYLLPLNENRGATNFTGYLTDALTERAMDFIDESNDAPFFLYLAYNTPHTPLQAPERLILKYDDIDNMERRTYLAMIDSLDQNIGKLLDKLESSGQRNNTLLFFVSDNGGVYPNEYHDYIDWADNAPFRGGKSDFFEGGIRVPFIASWPDKWPQGKTYEHMVISLDITATALSLAQIDEEEIENPLDGVNIAPFVQGNMNGPPHDALFWRQWHTDENRTLYAVRAGDTKLVKNISEDKAMLFNLQSDPGEIQNIANNDPDAVTRLDNLWREWNNNNLGNVFPQDAFYLTEVNQFRMDLGDRVAARSMQEQIRRTGNEELTCANGIAVAGPNRPLGLVSDCEAMMLAKDALAGGDAPLNWSPYIPIHRWNGVTLNNSAERVVQLNLTSQGLRGNIPPELGNLDQLEVLRLNNNSLTGEIPHQLGELSQLRTLALSDNLLTGNIPAELSRISSLEELWLRNNGLDGQIPHELESLPNLALIRLSTNQFTGCIPERLRNVESNDLNGVIKQLGITYCGQSSQ